MSEDLSGQVVKKETPKDFFEAIGGKVSNFSEDTINGDADDDDRPPVEEIESLCMNCGENVSGLDS